jgi:predicted metalloprotease with PDZ domain
MQKKTALALCFACCVPGVIQAQTPRDSTKPMMSGVVHPTRPAIVFLGLGWRHRTGEPFKVSQVLDDSPASRAGLLVGDALLAVDGEDPTQSGVLFPNNAPGRHYRLRVQRGDEELELEIISDPPRPLHPTTSAQPPI